VRLEIVRWTGHGDLTEAAVRARLEAEGFSTFCWSDAPEAHYEPHTHDHDESNWLIAGAIRFGAAAGELALAPGDRLMLPAHTRHTADAGPDGATYVIGQRV
jgi:quercetin dioxygenase-like cupin family protein